MIKFTIDELNQILGKELTELEALTKLIYWDENPDYGDLFTFEEFTENVKSGGFIPYDGFGYLGDKDKHCNISIWKFRSSFSLDQIQALDCLPVWEDVTEEFRKLHGITHVIWFNR